MNQILKTIDRASETLYDGFVSEALGRRGAVLFYVLLGGLMPLASFVNALWAGLVLLVNWVPTDLGLSVGGFYSLCVGLILAGIVGAWVDIRTMSQRPIVDRANPPRVGP